MTTLSHRGGAPPFVRGDNAMSRAGRAGAEGAYGLGFGGNAGALVEAELPAAAVVDVARWGWKTEGMGNRGSIDRVLRWESSRQSVRAAGGGNVGTQSGRELGGEWERRSGRARGASVVGAY